MMSPMRLLPCLLVLVPWLTAPAVARQASLEYDVKAAFLLNFGRYVQWPSEPSGAFQLCVLGSNPFGKRLELAVSGERWHEKAIDVRQIQDPREARECHVLYVPASATERFLSSGSPPAQRAVLTIGETRAFLLQGGIIQLFLDDNKVRFSINQTAAEASRLQISSRLLRLAREVVGQPYAP